MPVRVGVELRRMGDTEFSDCVYGVMGHAFDIQCELGRLFHESIYQQALACRLRDARCEVPVHVHFDGFNKTYFLDLLVDGGAVFELKAVESISEQHRRQLLQYLFLVDLPHGKLVNFRAERVQHEFVNNTLTHRDRTSFAVEDAGWDPLGQRHLKPQMIDLLRDWGTGLDVDLYGQAAAHFCGQSPDERTMTTIHVNDRIVGNQPVRMAQPGVALKCSALPPKRQSEYEPHLRRFLHHTDLDHIQWINITRQVVSFKTIKRE